MPLLFGSGSFAVVQLLEILSILHRLAGNTISATSSLVRKTAKKSSIAHIRNKEAGAIEQLFKRDL